MKQLVRYFRTGLHLAVCSTCLGLTHLASLSIAQTSSVPPLMNYQGKLTKPDGSPVEDGQYKVRFSIHDALTGGTERWFQTMDPVLVRNGVFSVLLGSGNPLSSEVFSGTRYLEIKVGDLAPLSPRQPIVSVGYSFVAQKAEVATTALTVQNGGVGTGGLADGSVTTAKLADGSVTAAKLSLDSASLSRVSNGQLLVGASGSVEVMPNLAISQFLTIPVGKSIAVDPFDNFLHQGNLVGHYSLGWHADPAFSGAVSYLSGYAGLKFFTNGLSRVEIHHDGTTVLGSGATIPIRKSITLNPADNFQHQGNTVGHYSLGWFPDPVSLEGPLAYLSGYGGVKLFTGGLSRVEVTQGGALIAGGNMHVAGTLTKSGGSFRIDHPQDPANKYLYHSFVESPDMKNVYDGVVTLGKGGVSTVYLPEYFESLNRDCRYQLTCIGGHAPVYVAQEVKGNRFQIAGGTPGMKVSWQVTGIRKDPWAEQNRIVPEVLKPKEERGTYLFPNGYPSRLTDPKRGKE